jgi:hypothetical protein
MVYMSVTKVACTSLRWMLADLAGEDFETFYRAAAPHQSRLMTIHTDRSLWKHALQIKNTPPEVVAQISRDNGWFIFTMVRDPWTRLWSGWQSKFLVQHAYYKEHYGAEPWFPRVPESAEDVLEDWTTFIETEPWTSHPLLSTDVHFLPQTRSVRPKGVNYTRIYDLKDMPALLSDIESHLESLGLAKPLYLPRANETPLALTEAVLANGIAERIKKLYKPDFDVWGERWSVSDLKYAKDGWSRDAIRSVGFHTVANERLGDLSRELRRTQRELASVQAQNAALERQWAARGPIARFADRVQNKARRELRNYRARHTPQV